MILFISPHLDDVALSCGGLVSRLAKEGHPVSIATVCTADAPAEWPLSPAAQHEHRQWQLGDQPYRHRRVEDVRACDALGARLIHLGLLDAIYRHDERGVPLYASASDFIGGNVHPHDWQFFFPQVKAALGSPVPFASHVFCPLAIGGHVDHVVVRCAVEALAQPTQLRYYEDFPYAATSDQAERTAGLAFERVALTEDEIEARVRAIACYPSQMFALFGSADGMPEWVRGYIARAGGERYWHPADDDRPTTH